MNKIKKFSLIVILPVFVLVLSGCGQQTSPQTTAPIKTQESKTTPPAQNQATANESIQAIPPLPTDNRTAIDSETQGIDASLNTIDASLSSDATDTSLGL